MQEHSDETSTSAFNENFIHVEPEPDQESNNSSYNSDESLGILSIKSEDCGPYIDKMQLKSSRNNLSAYINDQKSLALRMLQDRESMVPSLPSRLLKPSEFCSISDSCLDYPNGSTVSESDLLKQSGINSLVNNTSTPRSSISCRENASTVDLAEVMARMSTELRSSDDSFSTALNKMEKEYQRVRNSLSFQSDMFKPAEELADQLLADELSWKREKSLPVEKIDITEEVLDMSKNMSVGAFFKQRSEDISNIIPSRESLTPDRRLKKDSCSQQTEASSMFSCINASKNGFDNYGKDSLSLSKIAKILHGSKETPTKLIDFMLQQGLQNSVTNLDKTCSSSDSSSKENTRKNSLSSISINVSSKSIDNTTGKENFNSVNVPQGNQFDKLSSNISKSLTSLGSTSSLSNLPGGKLPIETTHCELVWNCVKSARCETKDFTLRNRSSDKLKILCTISGPSFRFVQERSEDSSNSIKLILRAHETKSISVIFNPLHDGAFVDEILFCPCNPNLLQIKKQSIKLFGYGGFGNLEFKDNILKDITGKHWLKLETVFERTTISKSLLIFNKGTLPIFAMFNYRPKNLAFANISVIPNEFILKPREQKKIDVICKVNRTDVKHLQNSMSSPLVEIGAIEVITGPEPTRGRIRRVCGIIKEKGLESDALSNKIQQMIPGENIPSDIIKCKESVNSLNTLLQGLTKKEIVLIVENDLDSTIVPSLADDTSMFLSLMQESTVIEKTVTLSCKLEPKSLILTPPIKMRDCVFLISESESTLPFEVHIPSRVDVSPRFGEIQPHGKVIFELQLKNVDSSSDCVFNLSINVGGCVLETEIKIIYL